MADTTKKTTRSKKATTTPKTAGVPTAKKVAASAAAAEAKGQPAPAAVKSAVTSPASTTVAAKPAIPAVKAEPKLISKVERQRMIEQAAYFRAEKHGFQGDSSQHWSAAEAEIDAELKRRNIRVA